MTDTSARNQQQIEFWNGEGGRRWIRQNQVLDALIQPIGAAALDAAAPRPGERAIDIGCGCGNQTLVLARRIGAGGHVLGIDVSEPMLELARADAAADRTPRSHIDYLCADAASHRFTPGGWDLLFSRFGVMFFDDPVAAFTNLHAALRPEGRMAFCCWRPMQDNEQMVLPLSVALQFMPPPEPTPPDAPGPFAFADRARVLGILERAGFRDATMVALEREVRYGAGLSAQEIAQSLLDIGPASRLLAGATEEVRALAAQALREKIAVRCNSAGIAFTARFWVVTARR